MYFIECEKASFCYFEKTDNNKRYLNENPAVDNFDFTVSEGEFIAILGRNGSGKSTFAKLLNAIFKPTSGKVFVCGMDSSDDKNVWEIRKNVGMVFQNPDNQIVAAVVEEDVAFGLENIGVLSEEIIKRVKTSLAAVDMLEYAKKEPHLLSGGQKQRIAIAGILAMRPKCVVFDEATAMLDPVGRKKIIDIIIQLNKTEKMTVIIITHFMEEAILADKIFVMEKGKAILQGSPKEVFSDADRIRNLGLDLPVGADIANRLKKFGFAFDKNIVYDYEIVDYILKNGLKKIDYFKVENKKVFENKVIEVKNVSFVYGEKSAFQKKALDNVSFDIFKGEILTLIGKTGSGKSTLVQTLNGIVKPLEGEIFFCGDNILKSSDFRVIRQKIGVVFQYPEYQLFEETVFKDAMFGPLNMGLSEEEAKNRVLKSFDIVGIGKELFEKSPFELSGGQKRRVAIAGILAMEPEVLILDEPTAGLDPLGRDEILGNIQNMRKEYNMTIVMVSHSMEEVCKIADRIIVMEDGRIMLCGNRDEVFSNGNMLEKFGVRPPAINSVFRKISEKGLSVPENIYTIDDAVDFLRERL